MASPRHASRASGTRWSHRGFEMLASLSHIEAQVQPAKQGGAPAHFTFRHVPNLHGSSTQNSAGPSLCPPLCPPTPCSFRGHLTCTARSIIVKLHRAAVSTSTSGRGVHSSPAKSCGAAGSPPAAPAVLVQGRESIVGSTCGQR